MLANRKRVYGLKEFTVQHRAKGWYFWRTYGGKADPNGPYGSIASVATESGRHARPDSVVGFVRGLARLPNIANRSALPLF